MSGDYIGVYCEINPGTKIKPKFPATLGLVVNGRLCGNCDYVQYIGKGKFALLYPNGRVRKDIVPDVVDYEEIKLDARMDDGFSRRLDKSRLQALGNAVVPRCVYPIFDAIRRIERGEC